MKTCWEGRLFQQTKSYCFQYQFQWSPGWVLERFRKEDTSCFRKLHAQSSAWTGSKSGALKNKELQWTRFKWQDMRLRLLGRKCAHHSFRARTWIAHYCCHFLGLIWDASRSFETFVKRWFSLQRTTWGWCRRSPPSTICSTCPSTSSWFPLVFFGASYQVMRHPLKCISGG